MNNINKVILIGNLTKDAELKEANGFVISKLSIAINKTKKVNGNIENEVSYFDLVLFGKMASALNQYLLKGTLIGVEGELKQNRWDDKEGKARSKVEIIVNRLQLLGNKNKNNESIKKEMDIF